MHESLDDLQPLGEFLRLEIRRRFGDLDLESFGDMLKIHVTRNFTNRFGAIEGGEGILAIFHLRRR